MATNEMFSVVYTGADSRTETELVRLAELVGVDFMRGHGPAVLTFADAEPGAVTAHFHDMFSPYFPRGNVRLEVREDTADILELMAAVGATLRGRVVGVVGAHGGAGTTTLAAWLARHLAAGNSAGLIDADPASVGIDHLLAMDTAPGQRWADIVGEGAILAGRLASALPVWNDVHVVSADERGGAPTVELAAQVISALAQTQPWTVVDFAPQSLVRSGSEETLIDWCDRIVLVTRGDAVSLAHAHIRAHQFPNVTVVGMGMSAKAEGAHAAQVIGVDTLYTVRTLRGMRGDIDHGVAPGDRVRSGTDRDIGKLRDHLEEVIA